MIMYEPVVELDYGEDEEEGESDDLIVIDHSLERQKAQLDTEPNHLLKTTIRNNSKGQCLKHATIPPKAAPTLQQDAYPQLSVVSNYKSAQHTRQSNVLEYQTQQVEKANGPVLLRSHSDTFRKERRSKGSAISDLGQVSFETLSDGSCEDGFPPAEAREEEHVYETLWEATSTSTSSSSAGDTGGGGREEQLGGSRGVSALQLRYPFRATAELKNASKRRHIAGELLETEELYVQKLFTLTRLSWQLEGAALAQPDLSADLSALADTRLSLVANLEALWRLHDTHVLPQLRTLIRHWSPSSSSLGRALGAAPFLKLYFPYVTSLSDYNFLLADLKKKSAGIAAILNNMQNRPAFGQLSVEMVLMEPFQRLTRYKLLLSRYLEYTEQESEDYTITKGAYDTIVSVLSDIDQHVKAQEDFDKLDIVQARLVDYPILDPGRTVVLEGAASVVVPGALSAPALKRRHLILLSDQLLITSKDWGDKLKVKQTFPVEELQVDNTDHLQNSGLDLACVLLVKVSFKSMHLLFGDEKTKLKWEEQIVLTRAKYCIQKQYQEGRTTAAHIILPSESDESSASAPGELFTAQPAWYADSYSSACMQCKARFFPPFRLKHRCKGCGKLVCWRCVDHKAQLPYLQHEVGRVCTTCYAQVEEEAPYLKVKPTPYLKYQPSGFNSEEAPASALELMPGQRWNHTRSDVPTSADLTDILGGVNWKVAMETTNSVSLKPEDFL